MPESLFSVKVVPDFLRVLAVLEPPAWTRLEPQSVTGDPSPGLRAALHDPLWLLGRQWQFGEFEGDDAGMPISAKLSSEMQRVTAWQPGDAAANATVQPLPPDEPLDPFIEREPSVAWGPGLRARAEAGATLVAMLADAGLDVRDDLVEEFPLPLDEDPPEGFPAALWVVPARYRAVARTSPDGEALAEALEDGTPDFISTAAASVRADAKAAAAEWLAWYRTSVSPPVVDADEAESSWIADRLEYRFSLRTGKGREQRVFRAPLHEGGAIDWYSVDHDPAATLSLAPETSEAATVRREQVVLASPLRFGGMPSDRLWQFEDGAVNLGKLETQAHDLARLVLVEFAMVYSAEWFVVPLDVDVGSYTRVAGLEYTTTFGDRFTVNVADDTGRAGRFRMFLTNQVGSDKTLDGLLVPPSARGVIDGSPLEDVLFLRDEMANMCWAIEKTVPTVSGDPRSRDDEPRPRNAVEDFEAGAELQYLLQTAVPPHWIPLVPVPLGTKGGFKLRKGTMSDTDDSIGVLLDPTPFTLFEEEVPREGVRVRRVPSLARTRDGRYLRWITRRVSVGRGEGGSALAYDATLR